MHVREVSEECFDEVCHKPYFKQLSQSDFLKIVSSLANRYLLTDGREIFFTFARRVAVAYTQSIEQYIFLF